MAFTTEDLEKVERAIIAIETGKRSVQVMVDSKMIRYSDSNLEQGVGGSNPLAPTNKIKKIQEKSTINKIMWGGSWGRKFKKGKIYSDNPLNYFLTSHAFFTALSDHFPKFHSS